jgi:cytochrome oxidase Cu insertion factor (SCO1/SenC/PrrC family)
MQTGKMRHLSLITYHMLKAYARSNFNEKWHFIAASSEKKLEIVNNEHNLLFFSFF